ncbi:cupredoxin domain-containing protein [Vulgatibacter sp.]|uniref:cupredoxin domain-containing protein n=1 Tax=Vulgatibacter sp. TaxID=1971226 RepID=UPI003561DF4D
MQIRFLAALAALPLAIACSEGGGHADHAEKKAAPAAEAKPAVARPAADGTIEVHATRDGFEPSKIEVEGGKPVNLVFVREIEKTCMTGVVFPDLKIEKDLPVGEKVTVTVTPEAGGTIHFQCPMGMGKSTVVGLPKA